MLAALFLLALRAELITVRPGPGQTCPSVVELADALSLRLPGAVIDDPRAAGASVMTLEVSPDASAPGSLSVVLRAPGGELRLARRLPPVKARARGMSDARSDCKALGDTIALIVERHVRELGLVVGEASRRAGDAREEDKEVLEEKSLAHAHAGLGHDGEGAQTRARAAGRSSAPSALDAEPPATPPGWEALGLGALATGRSYPAALALGLGLRSYWGGGGAFFAELQALNEQPESLTWSRGAGPPGRGTVRGHVLLLWVGRRLGAITRTLGLPGELDAFACAAARLLVVQELTPPGTGSSLALEPMAGLGFGWSVRPVPRLSSWFVRLSGWGGTALTRHVVRTPSGTDISETPRIFGAFALGAGLQF